MKLLKTNKLRNHNSLNISNNIIYRFRPINKSILTFPSAPAITEQDYISLFVGIIRLIKEDAKREVLKSMIEKQGNNK